MASKRISLSDRYSKFVGSEFIYYTDAAMYLLCSSGITNPSDEQVSKTKKSLFNRYFGLSLILGTKLTQNEINILYKAASGDKKTVTSSDLGISETRITQLRLNAMKKLQSENVTHAVYKLTRLGYLPTQESEGIENIFTLIKS